LNKTQITSKFKASKYRTSAFGGKHLIITYISEGERLVTDKEEETDEEPVQNINS